MSSLDFCKVWFVEMSSILISVSATVQLDEQLPYVLESLQDFL